MSLASQITALATAIATEVKAVRGLVSVTPTFTQTGMLAVTTDSTAKRWYNDTGRTLQIAKVRVSVTTVPSGTSLIVDVHKNGTTIFTTQANRPTVAISGTTGLSSAPNVTNLLNGEYLTINVDQASGGEMETTVVMS